MPTPKERSFMLIEGRTAGMRVVRVSLLFAASLAAALFLIPGVRAAARDAASAESPHRGWSLRVFGIWMEPTGGPLVQTALLPGGVEATTSLEFAGGSGFGVAGERRFGRRWGLDIGGVFANLDLELSLQLDGESGRDSTSVGFTSLYAGPTFHITPDRSIDLYAGLLLGFVDMGDGFGDLYHDEDDSMFEILGETFKFNVSDAFFLGGQLGLDIPFGKGTWALHLGVRYMPITVDVDEIDIEVDPIAAEVGFRYRF
jgi:hypothetical protein